jgi:ribosomal protein S18 acetylase RimI-like enzyme
MQAFVSRQEMALTGFAPMLRVGSLNDVRIRPLVHEDFEKVFRFRRALYEERKRVNNFFNERDEPYEFSTAKLVKGLVERSHTRRAVASVAEAAGEIVGMASVERFRATYSHDPYLTIYVAEGWRNIGVGPKLMRKLIEGSTGVFEVLKLNVSPHNEHARRLYDKLGFREIGPSATGKHIIMALGLPLVIEDSVD